MEHVTDGAPVDITLGGTHHFVGTPPEVVDAPPTHAEVQQALAWLYGTRVQRRKYERKRTHITYKQRDEVAHVLLRIVRARTRVGLAFNGPLSDDQVKALREAWERGARGDITHES